MTTTAGAPAPARAHPDLPSPHLNPRPAPTVWALVPRALCSIPGDQGPESD
jgi:hypothetical protein